MEERTLLSAASQALVGQMYQDLLQRPADAGGLANWSAALDQGASPVHVALSLSQSPEGRTVQVQSLYQQFLHRAADASGLKSFTQALAAGQTLEQVAAAMVASPEYYQSRGNGNCSDSGFLNALYQDALSRPVDASGAASFGQALASGTARAQVAAALFSSPELQQAMVQHDYQSLLHRAADAAGLTSWTQAFHSGARHEQIVAGIVGSSEYAQTVQSTGGSLQQTLLPNPPVFGLPVLVTNTPSQPVPVQQTGPWTVGISGTVQVASSLTNPVFERNVNDAVQPVQANLTEGGAVLAKGYIVPAGKRLVIEDISVEAVGGVDFQQVMAVRTVAAGINVPHYIPMTLAIAVPAEGIRYYVAHEQVRLYADPGTKVVADQIVTKGSFSDAVVIISGYLVNVA